MSAMDKIRSFAEARSEDAELLPPGCLSYGDAREIIALGHEVRFYRVRIEALQQWQRRMRDPERTVVCDILANGHTLAPAHAGDRYKVTT